MDIRYFSDPETGLPHTYRHGVTKEDVAHVLRRPIEDRPRAGGLACRFGANRNGTVPPDHRII
jgi:hypothetical protein